MANKKDKFDADTFLEKYEENTIGYAIKRPTPSSNEVAEVTETKSPADEPLSAEEVEYMERFIIPNKFSRMSRIGKQVPVTEDFKKKIQKLMLFFSDNGTITEYVNNVLEQHFKDYDEVIRRMFNKHQEI